MLDRHSGCIIELSYKDNSSGYVNMMINTRLFDMITETLEGLYRWNDACIGNVRELACSQMDI